jgi:hypothetical protein
MYQGAGKPEKIITPQQRTILSSYLPYWAATRTLSPNLQGQWLTPCYEEADKEAWFSGQLGSVLK